MNEVKFVHASDIMLEIGGLAIKYNIPISVTRMPRGCGYFLYVGLGLNSSRLDTGLRELYKYTEEEWDKTYKKIDEELSKKFVAFEWKKNESEVEIEE